MGLAVAVVADMLVVRVVVVVVGEGVEVVRGRERVQERVQVHACQLA